jgi:hypothetical protein
MVATPEPPLDLIQLTKLNKIQMLEMSRVVTTQRCKDFFYFYTEVFFQSSFLKIALLSYFLHIKEHNVLVDLTLDGNLISEDDLIEAMGALVRIQFAYRYSKSVVGVHIKRLLTIKFVTNQLSFLLYIYLTE